MLLTYRHIRYKLITQLSISIFLALLITVLMFIPTSFEWLAQDNQKILEEHQWWRLISSSFVHGDWAHFQWNFIVLVTSSIVCEQLDRRLFIYYLIAASVFTGLHQLFFLNLYSVSFGYSSIASGSFSLLLSYIAFAGIRAKDFWLFIVPFIMLIMFIAHELNFLWAGTTGWQALGGDNIGNSIKSIKPNHLVGIATGLIMSIGYYLKEYLKQPE